MDEKSGLGGDPVLVTDGEWAGWSHWPADPYETRSGPYYLRHEEDGLVRCAFKVGPEHMNAGGVIHGGCLMTFADFSLFEIAWRELRGRRAVTVSLAANFIGTAAAGEIVEATGDVIRVTASLVFSRCLVTAGEKTLLSASATIRRFEPR